MINRNRESVNDMADLLITELRDNRLWAIYRVGEYGDDTSEVIRCSGWIPNLWNLTQADFADGNRPVVQAEVESKTYTEHTNGGRTNNKEYVSPSAYFADPYVKERYMSYLGRDVFDFSFPPGDPDKVDMVVTFRHFGVQFSLRDSSIDVQNTPLVEWYSEYHQTTAERLATSEVFASSNEAIAGQIKCDGIFGDRYFPIAKFDLTKVKLSDAINVCESFKGCSTALVLAGGKVAFIGLRAKASELEYIEDVYEVGGQIVSNQDWEW